MNISRITMRAAVYAALLSHSAAAQTAPTNLVPNHGFENGLTGYTVNGGPVEVVPFSRIGPFMRSFGLHDDSALRIPLKPKQKVTVESKVPIPAGLSMARVSLWVGASQWSSSNEAQVRVQPFGLEYRTGSIYMPLLDSRVVDVSSWAGGVLPVKIEIEASPWYPHEIYLDDLAVEPVSPAQPG
jgi:hypothetical protein